jgi:hypothetical protein
MEFQRPTERPRQDGTVCEDVLSPLTWAFVFKSNVLSRAVHTLPSAVGDARPETYSNAIVCVCNVLHRCGRANLGNLQTVCDAQFTKFESTKCAQKQNLLALL